LQALLNLAVDGIHSIELIINRHLNCFFLSVHRGDSPLITGYNVQARFRRPMTLVFLRRACGLLLRVSPGKNYKGNFLLNRDYKTRSEYALCGQNQFD